MNAAPCAPQLWRKQMDTLVMLNLIGYAAVLAGGLVLGTLFGRSIVSDLSGIVHSLESRVIAVETTLHLTRSGIAKSDSAAAAIQSHAEATEKLAAAIEIHGATKAAGN